MTFTKLGTEFSDECADVDLSDSAFRTHTEAIQWLFNIERLDCHIPKHLVRRFAGSHRYEDAIRELVAHGFWRDAGNFYLIVHHDSVIRGGIVAQQKKRERDQKAQARARKKAQAKPDQASADVSADSDAEPSDYPDSQTYIQTAPTASAGKPCAWCGSADPTCGCLTDNREAS